MKLTSSLLTTFVLIAGHAQADDQRRAQPERDRSGKLPKFLHQFDTNEDGHIDEEERQAIRELRAKLQEDQRNTIDTNNDGRISPAETKAARAALREKIDKRRLAKFHDIAGKDGLISPGEYATIPGADRLPDFVFEAIFERLDRDKSGSISAEEFFMRLRIHQS